MCTSHPFSLLPALSALCGMSLFLLPIEAHADSAPVLPAHALTSPTLTSPTLTPPTLTPPAPVSPPAPGDNAPVLSLPVGATPLGATPRADVLPDGTPITLMLTQRLKSGEAKSGEQVTFEVAKQVLIGRVVVISVGTPAYGQVEVSQGAGAFGRAGTLRLRCDYLLLPSGAHVPIRSLTSLDRSGRSAAGAAGTIGILSGLVAGGIAYVASDLNRNLFSGSPDHTTPALVGLGTGGAVTGLVGSFFRGGNVTLDRGERLEVTVVRETVLTGSGR